MKSENGFSLAMASQPFHFSTEELFLIWSDQISTKGIRNVKIVSDLRESRWRENAREKALEAFSRILRPQEGSV